MVGPPTVMMNGHLLPQSVPVQMAAPGMLLTQQQVGDCATRQMCCTSLWSSFSQWALP
jgi:hypothetical protein